MVCMSTMIEKFCMWFITQVSAHSAAVFSEHWLAIFIVNFVLICTHNVVAATQIFPFHMSSFSVFLLIFTYRTGFGVAFYRQLSPLSAHSGGLQCHIPHTRLPSVAGECFLWAHWPAQEAHQLVSFTWKTIWIYIYLHLPTLSSEYN